VQTTNVLRGIIFSQCLNQEKGSHAPAYESYRAGAKMNSGREGLKFIYAFVIRAFVAPFIFMHIVEKKKGLPQT